MNTEQDFKKNLLFIIPQRFEPREELDKAVRGLELSIIQTINSNTISKEEAKEAKQQMDRTLAQINFAQSRYMDNLNGARQAGIIDTQDYERAMLDAQSQFSGFERMKEKARRDYREVVNWDF